VSLRDFLCFLFLVFFIFQMSADLLLRHKKGKTLITLFGRLRQGESQAEFPIEPGLFPTGVVSLEPVELTFCNDPSHTHFTGSELTPFPSVVPYTATVNQTVARPIPLIHRRRTIYQVDHLDPPQLAQESASELRIKRSLTEHPESPGGRRPKREDPPVADRSVLLQAGWTSYRIPIRVDDSDPSALTLGTLISKLGAQFAAASAGSANLFGNLGLGTLTFVPSEIRTEGVVKLEVASRTRIRVRDPSHLRALGFTQPNVITALQRPGAAEGQKIVTYYVENLSWTERKTITAERPIKSGTLFKHALRPFMLQSTTGDLDPGAAKLELDVELLSASVEVVVDYSPLQLPKGRASVTQQLIDGLLQLTADLTGLDSDNLFFSRAWPKAVAGAPGQYKLTYPKIPYAEKLKNVLTVRLTFGKDLAQHLGIGVPGYFELNGKAATQLTLEGLSEAGQHDPQLAVLFNEWPRGGTPKGSLASPNNERVKTLKLQFKAREVSLLAMQLLPILEEFDTASEGDQSLEKSFEEQRRFDQFAKDLAAEFARREQEQQAQRQVEAVDVGVGEGPDPVQQQQPEAALEVANQPEAEEAVPPPQAAAAAAVAATETIDQAEQLFLETQREPFETISISNPELQPPAEFTVLRSDYPARCSKPRDFPTHYSLILAEGEPLDYISQRGFLSLLALMNGTRPVYANGSLLKNLQHSRLLHIEIIDQSQHSYRIPLSNPYTPEADGFLRLTVICHPSGGQ
jgi:hypothetical protein